MDRSNTQQQLLLKKRLRELRRRLWAAIARTTFWKILLVLGLPASVLSFPGTTAWCFAAISVWLTGSLLWYGSLLYLHAGTLSQSAQWFDRFFHTNSRVTCAWEVSQHFPETRFAAYAQETGLTTIDNIGKQRFIPELKWFSAKLYAGICLSAILFAVVLLTLSNGKSTYFPNTENVTKLTVTSEEVRQTHLEPPQVRSYNTDTIFASANRADPPRWTISTHTSGTGTGNLSHAPSLGSDAATGNAEANQIIQQEEESAENQSSKSSNNMGSEHAGDNGISATTQPLNLGQAAAIQNKTRRSGRKREVRKNPERASAGAHPMLTDQAGPAGRELGDEKEGEGEPDNGRGGPNGEKKARGTASMLPVIPLPDQISGQLSPGEEISVPKKSPNSPEHQRTQPDDSGTARGGQEAPRPNYFLPRSIRLKNLEKE